MGIDLAKLERDARSRQVRDLLKAARRIAESDPDYAAQLHAEAMALNGDPAFAELRAKSGRCANAEILIKQDVEKALRRAPIEETARKAREEVAEVTAAMIPAVIAQTKANALRDHNTTVARKSAEARRVRPWHDGALKLARTACTHGAITQDDLTENVWNNWRKVPPLGPDKPPPKRPSPVCLKKFLRACEKNGKLVRIRT